MGQRGFRVLPIGSPAHFLPGEYVRGVEKKARSGGIWFVAQ
jgi:hypothetical protein